MEPILGIFILLAWVAMPIQMDKDAQKKEKQRIEMQKANDE